MPAFLVGTFRTSAGLIGLDLAGVAAVAIVRVAADRRAQTERPGAWRCRSPQGRGRSRPPDRTLAFHSAAPVWPQPLDMKELLACLLRPITGARTISGAGS